MNLLQNSQYSLERAFEFCWSSFAEEYKTLPKSTMRKNGANLHLEPYDYWIYYVKKIGLQQQYGILTVTRRRPSWRLQGRDFLSTK